MHRLIVLGAALAALSTAAPARAATYHVDGGSPAADDANPGSAAAPFRAIQRAADVIAPGDVVIVHPAVYQESVNLLRGGTSLQPVAFQGLPGAVLDGAGLADAPAGFVIGILPDVWAYAPVDFVRISGFEIRNYTSSGIEAFSNYQWDVPELSTGAEGWVISGNVIHHCYQGLQVVSAGLSAATPTVVLGNLLYANTWNDIHVHHFAVVERNVALSHASDQNIRSCGAYGAPGHVQRVANNVAANGVNGILVSYPGSVYENNVVMNVHSQTLPDYWNPSVTTAYVGGYAFETDEGFTEPASVTIAFNDVWQVDALYGNAMEWVPADPVSFPLPGGAGMLYVDPGFVRNTGDETGDYRPAAGSPLLDAGDPATPAPPGGGTRVDIGAFEAGAYDLSGLAGRLEAWRASGAIDVGGVARSLEQKVAAAMRAARRGRVVAARNILEAVVNEARAQAGKHVDAGVAAQIISEARGLLGTLPPVR
jgi:hypothetical protein